METPDKQWTHREVGLILRDSIAQSACQANQERDATLCQLELIEEMLGPIES
jgi:hypothetical protein